MKRLKPTAKRSGTFGSSTADVNNCQTCTWSIVVVAGICRASEDQPVRVVNGYNVGNPQSTTSIFASKDRAEWCHLRNAAAEISSGDDILIAQRVIALNRTTVTASDKCAIAAC